VISCRIEYNGRDYIDQFQPGSRNTGISNQYEECVIAPFNKQQINDYIQQYINIFQSPWGLDQYNQAFQQTQNLLDLVTNPFLLRLAMETLPDLVGSDTDLKSKQFTRAMLYDQFVTRWIKRAIKRRNQMCLDTQDQKELLTLSRLGFVEQSISYLKELSTAIYKYQNGNPSINGSKAQWKKGFFDERDLQQELLREATLIVRSGKEYKFYHKSILEYGLSLAIYDPDNCELSEDLIDYYTTIQPNTNYETLKQPQELASDINRLLDSPLRTRNLVLEPSIIQFLVDRVRYDNVFKGQLLSVIRHSKLNDTIQFGGSNAITILVKSGVQFNGADLRGIRIAEADLSYGVFDSVQLQESDLQNCNLQNIWFRSADLSESLMEGVRFGEWPYLLENCEVYCCAYSPNGKVLAVGLSDGCISLYDSFKWNKIQTIRGHSNSVASVAFSSDGN
jgi:uncharacterized protein YjbI with pentapeptide repeats